MSAKSFSFGVFGQGDGSQSAPLEGDLPSTLRSRLSSNVSTAFSRLLRASRLSLVRALGYEICSAIRRMKYLPQIASWPRCIEVALLCPSCRESGDRFCYTRIADCTRQIEELRKQNPWMTWADMALIVETWKRATDTVCCSHGSDKPNTRSKALSSA